MPGLPKPSNWALASVKLDLKQAKGEKDKAERAKVLRQLKNEDPVIVAVFISGEELQPRAQNKFVII